MLTNSTPEGHRVIFFHLANTDPANYHFANACKSFIMHSDVELRVNGSAPGFVILFDMQGVSFGTLSQVYMRTSARIRVAINYFYLSQGTWLN